MQSIIDTYNGPAAFCFKVDDMLMSSRSSYKDAFEERLRFHKAFEEHRDVCIRYLDNCIKLIGDNGPDDFYIVMTNMSLAASIYKAAIQEKVHFDKAFEAYQADYIKYLCNQQTVPKDS